LKGTAQTSSKEVLREQSSGKKKNHLLCSSFGSRGVDQVGGSGGLRGGGGSTQKAAKSQKGKIGDRVTQQREGKSSEQKMEGGTDHLHGLRGINSKGGIWTCPYRGGLKPRKQKKKKHKE